MCCGIAANTAADVKSNPVKVDFKELSHVSYALTSMDFLVIDNQEKMDKVFEIIHGKSTGSRLPPIPTLMEGDLYLVVKPKVKNSNDLSIESMYLKGKTLYIEVKPKDNPEFEMSSRTAPSIFVKLLSKVNFTSVKTIDIN